MKGNKQISHNMKGNKQILHNMKGNTQISHNMQGNKQISHNMHGNIQISRNRQGNIQIAVSHRVIDIIEHQRLVVFGSTALFTKVGKLCSHDVGKKGGITYYLCRQNKGRG